MGRSGQWNAPAVRTALAAATLRSLPPPPDGGLSLLGARTLQPQRGRKPPWGHFPRHGEHAPDMFGVEMVWWSARGARLRVPIAWGLSDPQRRGQQHLLLRQMRTACVPPAWGRHVVVVADAGGAAP